MRFTTSTILKGGMLFSVVISSVYWSAGAGSARRIWHRPVAWLLEVALSHYACIMDWV